MKKVTSYRIIFAGKVGSLPARVRNYMSFTHGLKFTDSLDKVTPEIVETMCKDVKTKWMLGIAGAGEALAMIKAYNDAKDEDTMEMAMTIQQDREPRQVTHKMLRDKARQLGMLWRYDSSFGEHRVNIKKIDGGTEDTACYTNDAEDAMDTMIAMARHRDKVKANRTKSIQEDQITILVLTLHVVHKMTVPQIAKLAKMTIEEVEAIMKNAH